MTDSYEEGMDEAQREKFQRMREHGDQEPVLPECIPQFIDHIQARSDGVMLPKIRESLTIELHKMVVLAPSAKEAIKDILRWAKESG